MFTWHPNVTTPAGPASSVVLRAETKLLPFAESDFIQPRWIR